VNLAIRSVFFFLILLCVRESEAACNVATTNINFGIYDVFSNMPKDSTGSISVNCDEAPPPIVVIRIGPSAGSGGFNPRQMRHTTRPDRLNYNLFIDSSRSVIWGDGTGGGSTVADKVTKNKTWVATLYGQIPAGQDVSVGTYSDTVSVTITW
jgi:spore coat protein U domain-containing protein, fimbrial subunit CupE1/2/3/6